MMVVIVRFLVRKTMILMVMEELVTIATVTVIIKTYRWNSTEKKINLT